MRPLANASFSVLYLVLVVRRSQLVLDFALTLQFWHLLLTTWYNWSLPNSGLWWITKALEAAIMVFGGRYFCRVRELQPIEFGMYEIVSTTATAVDVGDVEAQRTNGVDGA
jgi:protein SYS1